MALKGGISLRELPGLATNGLGRHLVWLDEVDSTNNYVKENEHLLRHLAVVIADKQTAGKGRLGRSWSAQPGESLTMTVLIKQVRRWDLTRLPLLTALGVQAGLCELCGVPFDIKWSNDILYKGKKVCGILCETKVTASGATAAVGIGVNLTQTREMLNDLGLVYASSLFLATNKLFSVEETAAAICNELESVYVRIFEEGFPPLRRLYREHCVTIGKQVRVTRDGREAEGLALDIADDGSLVCMIGGEVVNISAGEASIRGMMGYAD